MNLQPIRIIIFGTGEAARKEYAHQYRCTNVSISCFADNDTRWQGNQIQNSTRNTQQL